MEFTLAIAEQFGALSPAEQKQQLLATNRDAWTSYGLQLTPEEANEGREKVKEKARETAIENGILAEARENAEVLIREFLAGGYDLDVYQIIYE